MHARKPGQSTRRSTRTLTGTLITLLCALAAGAAIAETLVVDDQVQVRQSAVDRPKRGATMNEVEAKFGNPVTRHPTIGNPPITRWDYADFSVFFEHDRVINTVVGGTSSSSSSSSG